MSFFMFAGAISFPIPFDANKTDYNTIRIVALWLYFHAAVYSPGLGAVPFSPILLCKLTIIRANTVHFSFGKVSHRTKALTVVILY
jgi:hypothetical protein